MSVKQNPPRSTDRLTLTPPLVLRPSGVQLTLQLLLVLRVARLLLGSALECSPSVAHFRHKIDAQMTDCMCAIVTA